MIYSTYTFKVMAICSLVFILCSKVSMLSVKKPSNAFFHDSLYMADTNYLPEELVESLKGYLEIRGVDQEFVTSIVSFYRNFEHHAYVENFLGALHKFLK